MPVISRRLTNIYVNNIQPELVGMIELVLCQKI